MSATLSRDIPRGGLWNIAQDKTTQASIDSGTYSTKSIGQAHHHSEPLWKDSNHIRAPIKVDGHTVLIKANGIFGKSAELHHLLDYTKVDAVLINGSKLDSKISTSEVIPDNLRYAVYCKDLDRHGRDVIILIKNFYTCQIWTLNRM